MKAFLILEIDQTSNFFKKQKTRYVEDSLKSVNKLVEDLENQMAELKINAILDPVIEEYGLKTTKVNLDDQVCKKANAFNQYIMWGGKHRRDLI